MEYSDYLILDTWLYTTMYNFYRNYELAQEGLFSERDWQASVERYANWYLASGFGRVWWKETGRYFFDQEFVDYVDIQLEKGGQSSYEYWTHMRPLIRGEADPKKIIARACR